MPAQCKHNEQSNKILNQDIPQCATIALILNDLISKGLVRKRGVKKEHVICSYMSDKWVGIGLMNPRSIDKKQAQELIKETFESSFDVVRFTNFIKNLLNRIDEDSFTYQGQFIPDSYKPFISRYIRVGKFNDGENRIDILIVSLNKNTSIERARTMQRNFIAGYLQGKYGIPKAIEEGFIIEK